MNSTFLLPSVLAQSVRLAYGAPLLPVLAYLRPEVRGARLPRQQLVALRDLRFIAT